jgi:hypothetical protein
MGIESKRERRRDNRWTEPSDSRNSESVWGSAESAPSGSVFGSVGPEEGDDGGVRRETQGSEGEGGGGAEVVMEKISARVGAGRVLAKGDGEEGREDGGGGSSAMAGCKR